MFIITLLIIVVIFLTFLDERIKGIHGMKAGFIIMFLGCAIRYDFGNDYAAYESQFELFSETNDSFFDIFKGASAYYIEWGWVVLCKLFEPLGFYSLVVCVTALQLYSVYFIIKKYVKDNWKWFACAIYFFTPYMFLIGLSMMRQIIPVSLFLLSIPLILDKKPIIPLLLILAGAQIHTSAYLLLPFVLFGYLPFDSGRICAITIVTTVLLSSMFSSLFGNAMLLISGQHEQFEGYLDSYSEKSSSLLGFGYLLNTIIPYTILLIWVFKNKLNKEFNLFITLAIISVLLYYLNFIISAMMGRIAFYFTPFTIIALPTLFSKYKSKPYIFVLLVFFCYSTFTSYIEFFHISTWAEKYSEFHTIFEVI